MVEGGEGSHNVNAVLFSHFKKLVKVSPVAFPYFLYLACGLKADNALACAVYPYSCAVDVILRKLSKGTVPEFCVHVSREVVPVVPWCVAAVYPQLLAVHHELCSVNSDTGGSSLFGSRFFCLAAGRERKEHDH